MADYNGKYIYATTHDFKSNIAKYLRLIESGMHDAVFIKRYDKVVAFVMPYEKHLNEVKKRALDKED